MLQILLLGFLFGSKNSSSETEAPPSFREIFELKLKRITGEDFPLAEQKGKVLIVVNTASECGFTKQYADLEKLYRNYKDRGVEILAFPSDDFGGQEPGSNEEIRIFCQENYQTSFPLFEKTRVRSENPHPMFAKLVEESERLDMGGSVLWNFEKFIIDRSGQLRARFRSTTSPSSSKFLKEVEKALETPLN